jgi:hypothetical protein
MRVMVDGVSAAEMKVNHHGALEKIQRRDELSLSYLSTKGHTPTSYIILIINQKPSLYQHATKLTDMAT